MANSEEKIKVESQGTELNFAEKFLPMVDKALQRIFSFSNYTKIAANIISDEINIETKKITEELKRAKKEELEKALDEVGEEEEDMKPDVVRPNLIDENEKQGMADFAKGLDDELNSILNEDEETPKPEEKKPADKAGAKGDEKTGNEDEQEKTNTDDGKKTDEKPEEDGAEDKKDGAEGKPENADLKQGQAGDNTDVDPGTKQEKPAGPTGQNPDDQNATADKNKNAPADNVPSPDDEKTKVDSQKKGESLEQQIEKEKAEQERKEAEQKKAQEKKSKIQRLMDKLKKAAEITRKKTDKEIAPLQSLLTKKKHEKRLKEDEKLPIKVKMYAAIALYIGKLAIALVALILGLLLVLTLVLAEAGFAVFGWIIRFVGEASVAVSRTVASCLQQLVKIDERILVLKNEIKALEKKIMRRQRIANSRFLRFKEKIMKKINEGKEKEK